MTAPAGLTARWLPDADWTMLLSALEDASDYRRDQGDYCVDCDQLPDGEKCTDHSVDDSIAGIYDYLLNRLQGNGEPCPS